MEGLKKLLKSKVVSCLLIACMIAGDLAVPTSAMTLDLLGGGTSRIWI